MKYLLYDLVVVIFPKGADELALLAARSAFLAKVSRNCISITKYVTIEVTV